MGNIIYGFIFILGGLSGELVLVGTDSSMALVVIGFVMIIVGILNFLKEDP